jgi:hypothetical protein
MRHLLAVLIATCSLAAGGSAAGGLAAAEGAATRIASAVIHERARELRSGGQAAVAAQLEALANGLADGSVTLADAALVMQIANAGSGAHGAPPASATAAPAKPAEAPTTPAQVADILDGKVPEPAPAAGPVGTVLAASRAGDGKTMLVMISAGADHQVKTGQRFSIRRGEQVLAVVSAGQVKETMTICVAIPGSGPADAEIKEGDQVLPAP